ncbi:MAG: ATP-binding cassette domain-containing protein [Bacteroidota bacterium]
MSEKILKALMQLFAIIANPKSNTLDRRPIVESFLKQQLNRELVDEYLNVFDYFYAIHQQKHKSKIKSIKHTAASSVKVLMICTEINKELTQKQKLVVVIRLLEFINSEEDITDQEFEFVLTVAETFHVPKSDYGMIKHFVLSEDGVYQDSEQILIINSKIDFDSGKCMHLLSESFLGQILICAIPSANMHLLRFSGENELYINNQLLDQNKVHILSQGASIKNARIKPIYFGDIISTYNIDKSKAQVVLEVHNLLYKFKSGAIGLHQMNYVVKSGNLVGIMGASGSGKSTLLNVLNGNYATTNGEVLINGIDIHKKKDEIKGIVGYVSQDDMLIEELSVYQNLYYSAKLSFGNYSEFQILRIVLKLLKSLGLYEVKKMKVGSPLDKKISGGQRKRLNIALELIREPTVLFLDEPTSGLSSRDSENILDLLKELSLKGKLVFVVIHQPSSDIFKRFDRLLVLDKGGYLIYNGNPVESISYFKSCIRQANWNESECSICGNVNPEQIFNIVEAQVVDEYGNLTQTRKMNPAEWNDFYKNYEKKIHKKSIFVRKLPEVTFKIPNKLKQSIIYIKRDILSKLANKQYLFVNLFEVPILALILSYITRYYNIDPNNELGYSLSDNTNLPVYIFMSVIVALFIGLSLSAQEIIKDRLILKREAFLNLSRSSYLFSKIMVIITISAFQSLVYVIIGNSIMGINGMFWQYWTVLFSTWVAAAFMGLNISDAFKTTVTIYIIIPFLIIPQIILSGIIVKFDKLNPNISSPNTIPWYGEMMISRWAYEALAVYQFKNNEYEERFYSYDKEKSISDYKKNYWLRTLENRITQYEIYKDDSTKFKKLSDDLTVVRNEIRKEQLNNKYIKYLLNVEDIDFDKINNESIDSVKNYFSRLKSFYNTRYLIANRQKDNLINKLEKSILGKEQFKKLKRDHHNKRLTEFVRNSDELTPFIEYKGHLYQKTDPIFFNSESKFIKAHFYAPSKNIFGKAYNTIKVNIIIIWIISFLLYLLLYYRVLARLLNLSEYLSKLVKDSSKSNK